MRLDGAGSTCDGVGARAQRPAPRPARGEGGGAVTRGEDLDWPVLDPFVERRVAGAEDIDEFGHVNNLRYIAWAMEAAWAHSRALGFGMDDYRRIGAGCVVWRHQFDYLGPVLEGEAVEVATWIAENDRRVRMTRGFEMRKAGSGAVCFRGETLFVSIDLGTGRPRRMPPAFITAYAPSRKRLAD